MLAPVIHTAPRWGSCKRSIKVPRPTIGPLTSGSEVPCFLAFRSRI